MNPAVPSWVRLFYFIECWDVMLFGHLLNFSSQYNLCVCVSGGQIHPTTRWNWLKNKFLVFSCFTPTHRLTGEPHVIHVGQSLQMVAVRMTQGRINCHFPSAA